MKQGTSKIWTAKLKFLRRLEGYTKLEHTINKDIKAKLNIYNLKEKIQVLRER